MGKTVKDCESKRIVRKGFAVRHTKKAKIDQKLGKGGFYHDDTYKEVCCWTEKTRIKYVPNPKSGKSFFRYAKYENSRTVGEALANGSWPLDLLFDYQTGKLSVKGGPVREAPCMPDEAKTHTDEVLSKWYYRAHPDKLKQLREAQETFKAKSMGHMNMKSQAKVLDMTKKLNLKLDDFSEGMLSQLDAARKAADNEAKSMLARKTKITNADILKVLKKWAFHKNDGRLNVLPNGEKWVFSDTLGLVRTRDGRLIVNGITEAFPNVYHVLMKWLRGSTQTKFSKAFPSTSISLNYAYAARIHRDQGNAGPSIGMAVGNFSGGKLQYWEDDIGDASKHDLESLLPFPPKIVDVSQGPKLFDGRRAHAVQQFKGSRYSLVFFSSGNYWKTPLPAKNFLTKHGAEFPQVESMKYYTGLMPAPKGYKGASFNAKVAKAAKTKATAVRKHVLKRR